MDLKDGRTVAVLIAVGTFKRGPVGAPALFSATVTDRNRIGSPSARHPTDLPAELHRKQPSLPTDFPATTGALNCADWRTDDWRTDEGRDYVHCPT
jgi:hypothetical protein